MGRKVPQVVLVSFALLLASSCSTAPKARPTAEPPADFASTRIDYVDSDAFDELLESALVNHDPAIVIQTGHDKPDWGGRLNAWIAAWNRGGVMPAGGIFRTQAPLLPRVDAATLREFRLLVDDLMGRIEEGVKEGSAWWAQEKVRNRRVELLKPYSLRFHMAEDGRIQIILFNGSYAHYHRQFTNSLEPVEEEPEWRRGYTCSWCKRMRQAARAAGLRADAAAP
jgi:hypothetical protein